MLPLIPEYMQDKQTEQYVSFHPSLESKTDGQTFFIPQIRIRTRQTDGQINFHFILMFAFQTDGQTLYHIPSIGIQVRQTNLISFLP